MLENFVHGSMPIKLSEIISFSTKQISAWGGSYKQLKEDVDGLFTPESKGVIFAGTDEVIQISHTAYSKAIFAKGAIDAAKYIAGKEAGMYNMADVIG